MSSDPAFLDAAASIGRRLAADAVWDDGRCSWVGAVTDPAGRIEYRGLGPTLYGGTAGVGAFLTRLAAATGDADARRTAIGALRHALERARAVPPGRRDGLHAGTLGIVWAVATVDELRADALAAVSELRPRAAAKREPDVATGVAGTLAALLALGVPDRVDEAIALGDTLLARATETRFGLSWAATGHRWPRHLCGVSHGAGGIGWALLELYGVTGEPRFRAGAERAFAYERSWLDPGSGTWPDLRIGGQRRGAATVASPMLGTWCHGEAGIALSRLRATALLGPGPHDEDGAVALETTRRYLAEAVQFDIDDLTLCHGAAGAADVLLSAGGAQRDLAAELGHVAIERYSETGAWPCGAAGATTPALFRGLAGIGWFFLRLHDPSTSSPLALTLDG